MGECPLGEGLQDVFKAEDLPSLSEDQMTDGRRCPFPHPCLPGSGEEAMEVSEGRPADRSREMSCPSPMPGSGEEVSKSLKTG